MTEHRCIYCNGERLMAPHEPVVRGSIIICGACGSLMVAAVREAQPGLFEPFLRRPSTDEGREARRDPAVVAALDAYNVVTLEALTKSKKKRIAPRRAATLRLEGPEAGFVRAALLALLVSPFVLLGIGFWFGFVAGAHFHP